MSEARIFSNRHRIATALSALLMVLRIAVAVAMATLVVVGSAKAALVEGTAKSDLLFGADDDNQQNPLVQPAGAVNQSLNNADAMDGKQGDDVMIGLLGSDTMRGGQGDDVIVGVIGSAEGREGGRGELSAKTARVSRGRVMTGGASCRCPARWGSTREGPVKVTK